MFSFNRMSLVNGKRLPEDPQVLTYTKPVEKGWGTPALARGKLEGNALTEVRDLLVPEPYEGNSALNGRPTFGRDGMIYMSTGGNIRRVAQDANSLRGKILRPTIPSSAVPAIVPRSTATAIAIRWRSSRIPRPAPSGTTKTGPTVAMRSTSSCPAATTAGPT